MPPQSFVLFTGTDLTGLKSANSIRSLIRNKRTRQRCIDRKNMAVNATQMREVESSKGNYA